MDNNPIEDRHIRVFISSTFQDMEKEREQLIKKVFPVLRKKAAQRGVTLTELDLRWGITQEESENGKVLEICLKEIDNSRPFFIGLLGDRYGWCPSEEELEKNHNIEEMFPWVRQAIAEGKSVTEMEFLYGALFPKSVSKHIDAFFWIKKGPTSSDERQERLKQMVRDNSEYPCNDYSSPEDLGNQVTAAFEKILEERFPPKRLSEIETFQLEQVLYRKTLEKVYVPIEKNLSCLDNFLRDEKQTVLALIGDSGSGKSATISNWLKFHSDEKNFDFIYCFLQASNKGANINIVLEYLDAELSNLLGIETQDNILGNNNNAEEVFKKHFVEATSGRNLVMILDGINFLDEPNDKLLNWIPKVPDGSKIILSTLESDITFQSILRKEYHTETISLLDDNQIKTKYVKLYLGQYGKTLSEKQIQSLVSSPITATPDALCLILNELKNDGSYEELDNAIDKYSHVQEIVELYRIILDDAEKSFGKKLVASTLLSIAVSRNGLSEGLLIKLAESTQLQWSQFFCAFCGFFYSHQGLISFSDKKMQNVVLSRYQDSIEQTRNAIIADPEFDSIDDVLEVTFQEWKLGNIPMLNWFISFYLTLSYLVKYDTANLFKYWKDIRKSNLPRKRYYFHVKSTKDVGEWHRMGFFMYQVEEYRISTYYFFREFIKDYFVLRGSSKEDDVRIIYYLYSLAYIGDGLLKLEHRRLSLAFSKLLLKEARKYHDLKIFDIKNITLLGEASIANCHLMMGNNDSANSIYDDLLIDKESACTLGDRYSRAMTLVNAVAAYSRTDISKAEDYFKEAEKEFDIIMKERPDYAGDDYVGLLSMATFVYLDSQKQKQLLEKALYIAKDTMKYGGHIKDTNMAMIYSGLAVLLVSDEPLRAKEFCDIVLNNYTNNITDKKTMTIVLMQTIETYHFTHEEDKARNAVEIINNMPPDFSNYKNANYGRALLSYFNAYLEFDENPNISQKLTEESLNYFEKGNVDLSVFGHYYYQANDNLGRLLYRKGVFKQAIKRFRTAIQGYEKENAKCPSPTYLILIIDATNQLAMACLNEENNNAALVIMKENLKRLERLSKLQPEIYQMKANVFYVMAIVYIQLGENDEAKTYIHKALDSAQKGHLDQNFIEEIQSALSQVS